MVSLVHRRALSLLALLRHSLGWAAPGAGAAAGWSDRPRAQQCRGLAQLFGALHSGAQNPQPAGV